jgi:hypothetical protein
MAQIAQARLLHHRVVSTTKADQLNDAAAELELTSMR